MAQAQHISTAAPLQDRLAHKDQWDQLGFVPGLVVRACGMRRSGNHAILNWLQRNAPSQGAVFLNNCKPGANPIDNFATIEINAKQMFLKPGKDRLVAATAPVSDGAMFLFSIEDNSPADFLRKRALSGNFDAAQIDADLLIYRSFLNWSASLLKKMQPNDGYSLSRRTSIILHAIDKYTRLLDLIMQSEGTQGVVPICYDAWATSLTYRADILNRLNLPIRDNSLGAVQHYGGGSSFQKQAQSPQDLQTARRWQQMSDDPEFQAIALLASQDAALTRQLTQHFPQDAARLAQISHQISLPQGDLQ
ncbi:MAG: hypothetical protein L3J36_02530 [Rhodobacteraceae bacterium]|nr:hypothetical protein [Paracoccaceae bacterium]